jgi:hypothetical protein
MVAWMPLALGIPASLVAGYGFLRAQRHESEMVAMALERRLDAVGAGHAPPVKESALAGAFGRVRTATGRTRSAGAKR